MTEKRVKAWAVLTGRGELAWDDSQPIIMRTQKEADDFLAPGLYPGERAVPVTIIVEES